MEGIVKSKVGGGSIVKLGNSMPERLFLSSGGTKSICDKHCILGSTQANDHGVCFEGRNGELEAGAMSWSKLDRA